VSSARILIVEDQFVVALDVQRRLSALGYSVAGITARGEDAVRMAGELRPDLVLMDVQLQGSMDGVAAAEQIRNDYGLGVVYLTAHADEATLRRVRDTQPLGYVLKPFDEHELRKAIETALGKHSANRQELASESS
jgi:CheY-like chemotaxis protein